LKTNGHLYLSTPNYTGIHFVIPFILNGKAFHDPMKGGIHKYEFYAHVRYFTYKTLVEFASSFGFRAEKVYLPLPKGSTRYRSLEKRSKVMALMVKFGVYMLYRFLTTRWAFHPVIRFIKNGSTESERGGKPEKVIL
jgi:hypothetical protein